MGGEPAPGTGPATGSGRDAHDRVCFCHAPSLTTDGSPFRVCSPARGDAGASRALLWARRSPPVRWHASLSSQATRSCSPAAPSSRGTPVRRLLGPHRSWSSLRAWGTRSLAGLRSREAAPGERSAPSAGGRGCAALLARWEATTASTGGPTTAPCAMGGGVVRGAEPLCRSGFHTRSWLSCATGACSSRLCGATRMEHPASNRTPGHDPTRWRSRTFGGLARFGNRFPLTRPPCAFLFSNRSAFPSGTFCSLSGMALHAFSGAASCGSPAHPFCPLLRAFRSLLSTFCSPC